jgi:hypothetical protein
MEAIKMKNESKKATIIVLLTAAVFMCMAVASIFVSKIESKHRFKINNLGLQSDAGKSKNQLAYYSDKFQYVSFDNGKIEKVGNEVTGPALENTTENDYYTSTRTSLSPGGRYLAVLEGGNSKYSYSASGGNKIVIYDLKNNKKETFVDAESGTLIYSVVFIFPKDKIYRKERCHRCEKHQNTSDSS